MAAAAELITGPSHRPCAPWPGVQRREAVVTHTRRRQANDMMATTLAFGMAMPPGSEMRERSPLIGPPAPTVTYRVNAGAPSTGTLAAFGFGRDADHHDDPRWLRVALEPLGPGVDEVWEVDAEVTFGRD